MDSTARYSRMGTVERIQLIATGLGTRLVPGVRVLGLGCGVGRSGHAFRDARFEAYNFSGWAGSLSRPCLMLDWLNRTFHRRPLALRKGG
jgi:hypothetical protein